MRLAVSLVKISISILTGVMTAWTIASALPDPARAFDPVHAPVLSFSPVAGFDGTDAINPDPAPAGSPLTFSLVYTHLDNHPPVIASIHPVRNHLLPTALAHEDEGADEAITMFVNTTDFSFFDILKLYRDTVPDPAFPLLHNGDYTDGEQFALTVPAGFPIAATYEYHFQATDGEHWRYLGQPWVDGPFTFTLTPALPSNHAPALSFSMDNGYATDGINPDKGTANLTPLAFKVIYTDQDNNPPPYVAVSRDDGTGAIISFLHPDTAATVPITLRDGNYTNGEQYVRTDTFPKGHYQYHFESSDSEESARLPATGELTFETGYSNVAFLPGIQGSRLYKKEIFENQLWEPNRNFDVEKLYTSSTTGESLDKSIYTRDIIDEANIIPDPTGVLQANFYEKFKKFMDELADDDDGIINEWKALPYDWRLDFEHLIQSGIVDGENVNYNSGVTETPYLLEEIKKLIVSSKSGNVTIITHSMGGLIAKTLLTQIANENHPYHDLYNHIDRLVMVAPPQLGTPKAIEALLHAESAQLPFDDIGFLMDEERAREAAENMISAYDLLPSEKYFDIVHTPVINFDESVSKLGALVNRAGAHISSSEELYKFLLGDEGTRQEPDTEDAEYPNVLKPHLLSRAIATHNDTLDIWSPPPHMQVVQVAGWGVKTISHITYSCGLFCASLSSLDKTVKPMTIQGDGTVVLPSALMMEGVDRYYVNIRKHNKENLRLRKNRDHGSIFEIDDLQEFIVNIIQGKEHPEEGENTKHITVTEPTQGSSDTTIDFTLHSPVDIHLYDVLGSHTGLIENSDPDSDIRLYEKTIPNSYYMESGEVKYAGADGSEPIRVVLKGTDLGTFTLEIDEARGDTLVASTAIRNIPVVEHTIATLTVQTTDTGLTPINLNMDIDGNGTNDITVTPDTADNAGVSLAILKKIVQTLDIQKGLKKALVAQIEAAEKVVKKGFPKVASQILKTMTTQLTHFPTFLISPEDATRLIKIIDEIRGRLVQ